jgi:hypothetical protein
MILSHFMRIGSSPDMATVRVHVYIHTHTYMHTHLRQVCRHSSLPDSGTRHHKPYPRLDTYRGMCVCSMHIRTQTTPQAIFLLGMFIEACMLMKYKHECTHVRRKPLICLYSHSGMYVDCEVSGAINLLACS